VDREQLLAVLKAVAGHRADVPASCRRVIDLHSRIALLALLLAVAVVARSQATCSGQAGARRALAGADRPRSARQHRRKRPCEEGQSVRR
jgi:hypothetical protein